MMNDRKVINLEEGWDFMQARPRGTLRYSRGSLRRAALRARFPRERNPTRIRRSPLRARSDLPPSFAHEQKGIVKLRGILEKEQGEDAFTPQEYMNLYTCVPSSLPRLRSHLALTRRFKSRSLFFLADRSFSYAPH